jgi:hypothetical protein
MVFGTHTGANIGCRGITWTHSHWGEVTTGMISADMSGKHEGWFRIQLGSLDQWIILLPRSRHFGGRQWYFMCPTMNRPASVLWKPNGATTFRSQQTWDRRVAYPHPHRLAAVTCFDESARKWLKALSDVLVCSAWRCRTAAAVNGANGLRPNAWAAVSAGLATTQTDGSFRKGGLAIPTRVPGVQGTQITVAKSFSKLMRCSRPNRIAEPVPCPGWTIKISSRFTKTSRAGGPGRFNTKKQSFT